MACTRNGAPPSRAEKENEHRIPLNYGTIVPNHHGSKTLLILGLVHLITCNTCSVNQSSSDTNSLCLDYSTPGVSPLLLAIVFIVLSFVYKSTLKC